MKSKVVAEAEPPRGESGGATAASSSAPAAAESPRRMMRLSEHSAALLFAPSVFARAFESLRNGAQLQKWSRKKQTPVGRFFRLRVPTIPLDEDAAAEEPPAGARMRWAGGLLQAPAEETSTLSWDKEQPASSWLPAFGGAKRHHKVLNFRDVYKIDLWETPTANLIPGTQHFEWICALQAVCVAMRCVAHTMCVFATTGADSSSPKIISSHPFCAASPACVVLPQALCSRTPC